MINVLHLRDTNRVCGPGKTIIETVCETDTRQFSQKVGLFLLKGQQHNDYQQAAVARGVEVLPVLSSHPYDPRIVLTLVRIVKAHRIDVLHSHEYKSDILTYLVSRLYPVRTVSTIHGWIETSMKRRLAIGASLVALRGFDRVIAVSEATKQRIVVRGLSPERVSVIHNAIVTSHYDPDAHAPGFLRTRFRLPAEAVLIGNVGRLSQEKGQRDFLKAAAELSSRFPLARFVLIGDGPDRGLLERLVPDLSLDGRVIFTGHLNDVRPALRDLDLLTLSSHTEGLPNVVLESLCMNTPVLATEVGGTPEIIRNEVTGLLVPPGSPGAIAAGLRRLLEEPALANRLAASGRTFVHKHFSFTARVAREEALYRALLRKPVGGTGSRAAVGSR
jgi:glycosyltransferase involved in cell wall biosynthesis